MSCCPLITASTAHLVGRVNVLGVTTVRPVGNNQWGLCPLEVFTRELAVMLGNRSGDREQLQKWWEVLAVIPALIGCEAVPSLTFQRQNTSLRLRWDSSVQYETGTELFGNTYCVEQLDLLSSWLRGGYICMNMFHDLICFLMRCCFCILFCPLWPNFGWLLFSFIEFVFILFRDRISGLEFCLYLN